MALVPVGFARQIIVNFAIQFLMEADLGRLFVVGIIRTNAAIIPNAASLIIVAPPIRAMMVFQFVGMAALIFRAQKIALLRTLSAARSVWTKQNKNTMFGALFLVLGVMRLPGPEIVLEPGIMTLAIKTLSSAALIPIVILAALALLAILAVVPP
jgi:hypothetical protein